MEHCRFHTHFFLNFGVRNGLFYSSMHKLFLSTLVLLLTVFSAFGQTDTAAIFYEISGNKLAKPSYILGTAHAICMADMIAVEKLTPYLDKTDQMILELDMDDPATTLAMMGAAAMPGGKKLRDFYTEAEYAKVDAMLRDKIGAPADALGSILPTMLAVMVSTSPKSLGCTPSAVDTLVMAAAVERKKPVHGLETVESQLAVLKSQPLEKQAKDLLKMAEDPAKYVAQMKQLMATYKAQNADELYKNTTAQMMTEPGMQKLMLDDRNIAWIPKLETSMAEKPAFIAVGAAHLSGPTGVVTLLKKKGYKVRAIRF